MMKKIIPGWHTCRNLLKNAACLASGLILMFPEHSFAQYSWQKLAAAPNNGSKQDDIFFVNKDTGWAVNGSGRIHRTNDGGISWIKQLDKPGTYFRCIGFVNDTLGFAGNIGTDYFPNVSDTVPLYKTTDGGTTWTPVTVFNGPTPKGMCAISVVKTPFINAGNLDYKVTLFGAGRVGGPAFLVRSDDYGNTWTSVNLGAYCAMITDVHFFDKDTGFIFGGTNANISASNATILYTTNGGQTFTPVYTSSRTVELIWKGSFPSRKTGYATVLSYDTGNRNRYVVKTTDGGKTWSEHLLSTAGQREFGIGFINETTGWVGTDGTGFETTNGGATWTPKTVGTAANKIRVVQAGDSVVAYAIGLDVYKLRALSTGLKEKPASGRLNIYPNPVSGNSVFIETRGAGTYQVEITDVNGRVIKPVITRIDEGTIRADIPEYVPGLYIITLVTKDRVYTERLILGTIKP